jgi:hypothetical protein
MKTQFLFLMLLVFSGAISAQDTLFVKTGEVIPAVIVSKDNMEIKYKKFGQPEPAAIYSVFISDLKSIHFKEGIIADYTSLGEDTKSNQPETGVKMAGTMNAMKISFGVNANYFNRNVSDKLLTFWQYYNGPKSSAIGGNSISYPISLRMSFVLGKSGRNWIGDELQLAFLPKDAISATNTTGSNEIMLKNFYYNIIVYYGHTLNHKKNLAAIIEPGFDLAFMSGHIKLDNTTYNISGNLGTGFHIATGVDWVISKRFTANARVGQRFMTIKESHASSTSKTDYSTFYVNPSSKDLLSVKWNCTYASIGLSWSFYGKMKFGRPE